MSLFKDRSKHTCVFARDWGAELVLTAGDWTGGYWNRPYHKELWPDDYQRILEAGNRVYTNMNDGFQKYGLPFLMCVGDHEVGDNSSWKLNTLPARQIPYFKQAFANAFTKHRDGSPIYDGSIGNVPQRPVGTDYEDTSFAVIKNNVLFVSLDLHEYEGPDIPLMHVYGKDNCVRTDLDTTHEEWLDNVLSAGNEHPDVDHIVVFSHYPIMPAIAWWHSSCMTVCTGEASPLNALLKKHKVDVYISGEVHCFSVNMDAESEVVYLSHGAHNELVTWEVTEDKLTLSLMEKDNPEVRTGRYGDQPDLTNTGEMTIDKSGNGKTVSATGSMVPIDHQGLLWNWDFDESEMPREYINRGQGSDRYMRLWTEHGKTGKPWDISVVDGILGNAVAFHGNRDSHLSVFCDKAFSRTGVITYDRGLSMSAWIKTDMRGTGTIMAANSGYFLSDNRLLAMNVKDGKFAIGSRDFVRTTTDINDGNWHHVAFAQKRGDYMKDAILYVDGEVAEKLPSTVEGYNCVDIAYWECHVGNRYDLNAGFDGAIDDPGFWLGALSPAMVKAMYNSVRHSDLDFNAAQMDDLFHLFRNKNSGSVGGLKWTHGSYSGGAPGEIYKNGSEYFVVLDEGGNCMTTAIPQAEKVTGNGND